MRIALAIAMLIVVASCLLLLGWQGDAVWMRAWHLERWSLTISVAVGFLLAGLSLALQAWAPAARLSRGRRQSVVLVARLLALPLVAIALATLVAGLLPSGGAHFSWLEPALAFMRDGAEGQLQLPLMASVGFLLAGLGLLALCTSFGNTPHISRDTTLDTTPDTPCNAGQASPRSLAEYCAFSLLGTMGIPLTVMLYNAVARPSDVSLAWPPQLLLCFVLLAAGILAACPQHRVMALWSSNGPGGHLLRQLLPQSLLLLISLAFLVEWGARLQYYGREQVSPLLVLSSCGWLSILFWRAATMLDREHAVRLQGEAALFDASALLRAVSDNTPDAIFIRDSAGRFIFANPALALVLGKSVGNIIGCTTGEVLADASEAEMVAASDRTVLQAGRAMAVEETLHLASGVRTFSSTKAPWRDYRGKLLGVVGISTDITERKRIEDALRTHETQLQALVAARTTEVSELIGHLESTREEEKRAIARELHDELGSALTALSMHLAILLQQVPKEAACEERARQVRTLLTTIVQTTRRIQRGLRPDKLDVFGIKIAIAEQVQEFAEYTGIVCKVNLPDEELHYSPAIDIALFRMVQEALNNIAKHAKASHVSVVLDDTDTAIDLTVRDDGIGLPENFAGSKSTHGLRGMRERAGYLGGTVNASSLPAQGTTIRIHVPKDQDCRSDGMPWTGPTMAPAAEAMMRLDAMVLTSVSAV